MPAQGNTTVDFGAFPGKSDMTATVTGQTGISGGALVEAWIWPLATADHSVDEHRVEEITVMADSIVAATGFTIFARTNNRPLYGQWSVAWVWN